MSQSHPVQVIVQQPQGNSAAIIALVCMALGVLTCCLPVIPLVFAGLGIAFALLGILVSFTRGGNGLLFSIFALMMSFIPFLPVLFLAGFFAAVPAVQKARDAAKQAASQRQEQDKQPAANPSASPPAAKPEPTVVDAVFKRLETLKPEEPKAKAAPTRLPTIDKAVEPSPPAPSTPAASDPPSWRHAEPNAPEPPVTRTWTDAAGEHKTDAEFGGLANGIVTLVKADGRKVRIPLEKLSAADRKWIRDRAKH